MDSKPQFNQQERNQSDCLSSFIYLTSLAWLVTTALVRFTSTLFASTSPGPESNQYEWSAALLHAIALLIPLVVLARWWANPKFRAIYHAWLWSAGGLLLLTPGYLIEVDEAQAMAAAQILLLLLFIGLLLIQRKHSQRSNELDGHPMPKSTPSPAWAWSLAAFTGLFMLAPWVVNGALGSLLDSLLYLILAVELSIAAGLVIETFLILPIREQTGFKFSDYALAATGMGGVLHILANSVVFPFGGMHLLLWLSLPVLGWSLAAFGVFSSLPKQSVHSDADPQHPKPVRRLTVNGPARLLIILVLAGPLLFIDADELALVISSSLGEILFVALGSAATTLLVGAIAGLVLTILAARYVQEKITSDSTRTFNKRLPLSFLAVGVAVLIFSIWWFKGQPGLHGERMLIILKDQIDVSSAQTIQDYAARRQFVYQNLTDHAQASQAEIRQVLERFRVPYTPYYLLNAIETSDNPILRLYMQSRSDVDRILDSPRMRPLPEYEQESFMAGDTSVPEEIPWNLRMIHADQVWQELGVTGLGIIIGQSDSGVQGDHPDLSAQYRGKDGVHDFNWLDPWFSSPTPIDLGGHGTHTLGTALGKRTGVAPDAEWIACVNLARNLGNPALYLDCMQFMLAPFPQGGDAFTQADPNLGAHVLNNSWGCPEFEGCDAQIFLPSVKALQAAGIFVVAGAGNDGPACSTVNSPLPVYEEVFAVGAIDWNGGLAVFSSLGPVTSDGSQRIKPDLVAPGVDILSTLPGSTYGAFSGTSMASPHVAGVVALLWSANPALIGDIETTWQILVDTAQPYSGTLPACSGADQLPSTAVGYGVLDAYAAVQMAISQP